MNSNAQRLPDTQDTIVAAGSGKWGNSKARQRFAEAVSGIERFPEWIEAVDIHTEYMGGANPKATFTCFGTPVRVKVLDSTLSAHSFRVNYEHEAAHMIVLVVDESDSLDWVQGRLLSELRTFVQR